MTNDDKRERRKSLEQTMKQFNKTQKDNLLDFGDSAKDVEVIPTGVKVIDDFIGGGTKKGGFSIIYGGYSVGKSTLVLQQIADAQKNGKICCYIDLEHSFDKDRAKQLGVNLEELVLAEKCKNAEQALEIIRFFCKEKAVDYFAVDSVQAMSPLNEQENKGKERQLVEKEIAELARTLSKFFRVVSPDVFNARASVVMIGQIRIHGIGTFFTRAGLTGGEALKHWASQMLFIRQGQGNDAPMDQFKKYFYDPDGKLRYKTEKIKVGFDAVIKLEKTKSSKSASEGEEIHVPFVKDKGFVDNFEPTDNGIVIKGTPEQKEAIEKELIDKGIYKQNFKPLEPVNATMNNEPPTEDKDIKEEFKKIEEKTKVDDSGLDISNKEEPIEKKKKGKRGRPKGSKNKDKSNDK